MSDPIRIYDGATDEWRDATQRDLDQALEFCRDLGRFRGAIKNANTEYEANLAMLKEKYS